MFMKRKMWRRKRQGFAFRSFVSLALLSVLFLAMCGSTLSLAVNGIADASITSSSNSAQSAETSTSAAAAATAAATATVEAANPKSTIEIEASLAKYQLARAQTRTVKETRALLEDTMMDKNLPAPVRGAAATELAIAHENVWPSFVHKDINYGTHGTSEDGHVLSRSLVSAEDHPMLNRSRAVELYELGASLGNETAQFRMGSLYATGALGVPQDQVKMALHYYFAAIGGSMEAQMALGFRHSMGLGVPRDCKTAVLYYELAANKAADQIETIGVGPLNERDRVSLDKKSYSYTGNRAVRSEDEEVVDYYKHAAEKGDVPALVALGQIYFYGARGVERDHQVAAKFFQRAAATGEPLAQTSLAHMLVKGMAVKQDLRAAFGNFSAAAEAGSAAGMNGLGFMYLYGLHVEQDRERAQKFFNDAAEMGNAEAYYNLGALYVSGVGVRRRNYPTALNYFQMAVQKGHTLAMHKLAQMNLHGIGTPRQCENAMHLFKAVAERGDPVQLLSRAFLLWNSYDDADSSLQIYLLAAELGYEVAQSNAAWLLDDGADINASVFGGNKKPEVSDEKASTNPDNENKERDITETLGVQLSHDAIVDALWTAANLPHIGHTSGSPDALRLYELAAEQENVEARLKIGDYYYYGLGGMDAPDYELAAFHYKKASNRRNAQAMFNLGFMHQHGIGLDRDFHLAKRYYDLAEGAHVDAKVPVSLALSGLWMHRIYRAILFKESATDLPSFIPALARWIDFFYGNGEDVEQAEAAPPPTTTGGVSLPDQSSTTVDVYDTDPFSFFKDLAIALGSFDPLATAVDLEDDTVVAIVLSILLLAVLILRSREQQRRLQRQREIAALEQQEQEEEPQPRQEHEHMHQD